MIKVIEVDEHDIHVAYSSSLLDFDVDDAVQELAGLREVRAALADWENELTEMLAEALGRNTITVDGIGEVTVRQGAARKAWDHDQLLRVVLARSRDERIVDPETGEAEDLAEATLRVLTECAHIDYWRKGALSERGLDVDEFCETTAGRPRVVIQ
jgi:hypothetical protein